LVRPKYPDHLIRLVGFGKPLGHGRGRGFGSVDVRSAGYLLERDWRRKSV